MEENHKLLLDIITMLKKIFKCILLITTIIIMSFGIKYLKKQYEEYSIVKKMTSMNRTKYNISNNIKRHVSDEYILSKSIDIENCYKLVFEMNFDCSICLVELKEIYEFYNRISKNREIALCITTPEKSDGYIEYYLNQSIKKYDLWIIKQEIISYNIKMYLLDKMNNIVMAGDIIKYPFLKDKYIKKINNMD